MGGRLGVALKPFFLAAAELALATGDETAAQRLRQATLTWVSASLWHHVPASFVKGHTLWKVLGTKMHMSPETRSYVPLRVPFNHKLVHEQLVSLQNAVSH